MGIASLYPSYELLSLPLKGRGGGGGLFGGFVCGEIDPLPVCLRKPTSPFRGRWERAELADQMICV
jgi:hypothetical protein